MKISVSKGIEYFDTIEVSTAEELGRKACESNISTSVFKGGKRNIECFEQADVIGLDIDNDNKRGTPTISLAEAKRIFSPYKHVILSTRNHQKEKNGLVADRFRVILFFAKPITKPEDFYSTWFWLKNQFPWIDNQCKDPSRFWYAHPSVLSVAESGIALTPIEHVEQKKEVKDKKPTKEGEKGQLSKDTLNFLEFGVEAGSRNGTVYKVARDFKQNLYDEDETRARILMALSRNEVFDDSFTVEEAQLTIESAYSKDAKHDPRIEEEKPRAFKYFSIGDLMEAPDVDEDWLVQGLLIKGGMSVIVGMPKVGKTTLVRQLEKCVLRGEEFLGRKTEKGSVVHYSFDEKARTAKRHYRTLGLGKDDPMVLHFGTAGNEKYKSELEEDFLTIKPTIAVIDTLFDMVDAPDVNSYGIIKKQLTFFSSLAERTNCHIMFIHHQNKPNQNYGSGSGHSVLGSTAIFGSVDCCMIFEQEKDSIYRTLAVKGRAVDDFEKVTLGFDKDKMTYKILKLKKTEDFF